MAAALVLLVVTLLVASLVAGLVVLGFAGVGYLLVAVASQGSAAASLPLPTESWLLPGLALATLLALALVLWGERDAPSHAVAVTGAERLVEGEHPGLERAVHRVAQQVDVPAPTVYVAPTETPLSLTTGFRPAAARLVVSEGLLDALRERELHAVVAHELAHVANRDAAVMTAATLPTGAAERVRELLAGPTAGVRHGQVSRADYADAVMTTGLLLALPVWVGSRLLAASLSRTREFAADDGAVAITGDPAALAAALTRIDDRLADRPTDDFRLTSVAAFAIVEPARREYRGFFAGLRRWVDGAFATHPPTSARVERLRGSIRARERPAADPESGRGR